MSAIVNAVVAALTADTVLMATLTGGVHPYEETGRNGFSQAAIAAAYDTHSILKPCAIVHIRSDNTWGGGHDPSGQYDSMRSVLEIYFYDDGDRTYASVETACNRVETLLHYQYVDGAGRCKRINKITESRETQLSNALYQQLDLQFVRGRQLS